MNEDNEKNTVQDGFSFSHLGGDMATTRRYLDMASHPTSIIDQSNGQNLTININCLDPLGRNALLIGT